MDEEIEPGRTTSSVTGLLSNSCCNGWNRNRCGLAKVR